MIPTVVFHGIFPARPVRRGCVAIRSSEEYELSIDESRCSCSI